jgi:hypothetical protein
MTKILIGTTLAVFALAPALSSADCDYHNKASMASLKPAEAVNASQAAASKAPAAVIAKTAGAKQAVAKPEAAPKKDATTVVAKNN